jgi:hypothetical protein
VWRDPATLEPVLAAHVIEAGNGSAGVAEVDVGWGLTHVMEIGVAWSWRASDTFVSVDEHVGDDAPASPVAPTEVPSGTWLAGLRFGGGPFPASRIRPTVAGGLSVWVGRGVEADPPLGHLPPPVQLVGQVLPGIELDVSDAAGLYVRGSVDLPLWGGRVSEDLDGEPTRGQAGQPAPGGGITAGILLRAGPKR